MSRVQRYRIMKKTSDGSWRPVIPSWAKKSRGWLRKHRAKSLYAAAQERGWKVRAKRLYDKPYAPIYTLLHRNQAFLRQPKYVNKTNWPDTALVTVHHTADNAIIRDKYSAIRKMQQYQDAHIGKGWSDIGYHAVCFFTRDDGWVVIRGRDNEAWGAHNPSTNHLPGICVHGDYTQQQIPQGVGGVISRVVHEEFGIKYPRYAGHRQFYATACPGDLQGIIGNLK